MAAELNRRAPAQASPVRRARATIAQVADVMSGADGFRRALADAMMHSVKNRMRRH